MDDFSQTNIAKVGEILMECKRPLKERFRALFTLRNIGGSVSIDYISRCFQDSSALLKHECAYCLGQMQDDVAIPVLKSVLGNKNENSMVRHEAGEALGAIAKPECAAILEEYVNDECKDVAETCQIALDRIKWLSNAEKEDLPLNPYKSIDPAPPKISHTVSIKELKETLLDESLTLFERYRALFSLRNYGGGEAAVAIAEGLNCSSALFRHEIAYVLGQMQEPAAEEQLKMSLCKTDENPMVRHECAEALGAIATKSAMEVLEEYVEDEERVVRESCEVALDICEYEMSNELQYANILSMVNGAS